MVNYCNDDQTVPQGHFGSNFISQCKTTGGSVVDVLRQNLAFDSYDPYLNEITETVESLAQSYPMEKPVCISNSGPSGYRLNSEHLLDNDVTFYENTPSVLVKVEADDSLSYPCKDNQTAYGSLSGNIQLIGDDEQQLTMSALKVEIEYSCAMLNIPHDPYTWTPQQVKTWVSWTLQQFSVLPPTSVDSLVTDGTTFCLMSEMDFVQKFPGCPEYGQFLFGQLETWKNAYSLTCGPHYTDLDLYQNIASLPRPTSGTTPCPQKDGAQLVLPNDIPTTVMQIASLNGSDDSLLSQSSESRESTELGQWPSNTKITYTNAKSDVKHTITPTKHNIHLWQFLKELLQQPQAYGECIRWLDTGKGIFKIEDSFRVAKLWGQRKNRPAMNYDKLSRSIRQYYKKGIIKKTDNSKRLVYQFCQNYRT